MVECEWDFPWSRKVCNILDCKVTTTPMASNLKLLCDASLDSVDSMMYHQMIGSLMNMKPNILFVVNTLR